MLILFSIGWNSHHTENRHIRKYDVIDDDDDDADDAKMEKFRSRKNGPCYLCAKWNTAHINININKRCYFSLTHSTIYIQYNNQAYAYVCIYIQPHKNLSAHVSFPLWFFILCFYRYLECNRNRIMPCDVTVNSNRVWYHSSFDMYSSNQGHLNALLSIPARVRKKKGQ